MPTVATFFIKQADGTVVEIDANKDAIAKLVLAVAALGDVAETSAVAGGTGSIHAKTRLLTSQFSSLLGYVDGVEALLTTLNGYVDGVESLLTTVESDAAAIYGGLGASSDAAVSAGATGSVNAKLRLLTTQFNTLLGYVDGLEGYVDQIEGYTDGIETLLAAATPAGENVVGKVVGVALTPSASFTRPNDSTAYASGDLVANNVTAGSVTPLSFTAARVSAGSGSIRRARLKKSVATTAAASFRLHLYGTDPSAGAGISNGDNGVWLTKHASYLGSIDVTCDRVFSDGAAGVGVPNSGAEITFSLASGTTVYGLTEVRAAYGGIGTALEVFTWDLEVWPN